MALILWSNDYSVGIEALDADHIVVASLINLIDDAKQGGSDEAAVGRVLKVLVDHAYAHFAREEAFLEAHDYPHLKQHRQEHRLLADQLRELHQDYERTPDPAISREIMELLNYWLIEHILKVDMHYKTFLEQTGA